MTENCGHPFLSCESRERTGIYTDENILFTTAYFRYCKGIRSELTYIIGLGSEGTVVSYPARVTPVIVLFSAACLLLIHLFYPLVRVMLQI